LTISEDRQIVGIFGEADRERVEPLRELCDQAKVHWLESPSLPVLGAILGRSSGFIGHDSGISHLAAAAGCRCALLFGPTDPLVWAPTNPGVQVVRTPSGRLEDIPLESVTGIVDSWTL
jgi:heptosyltransferase-2